jgi:hypothetical protein
MGSGQMQLVDTSNSNGTTIAPPRNRPGRVRDRI